MDGEDEVLEVGSVAGSWLIWIYLAFWGICDPKKAFSFCCNKLSVFLSLYLKQNISKYKSSSCLSCCLVKPKEKTKERRWFALCYCKLVIFESFVLCNVICLFIYTYGIVFHT